MWQIKRLQKWKVTKWKDDQDKKNSNRLSGAESYIFVRTTDRIFGNVLLEESNGEYF